MAKQYGEIECYNHAGGTVTQANNNNGYGFEMSESGYIAGTLSNASGNRTRATNFKATASWSGTYPNDYASVVSDSGPILFNTSGTRTQVSIADNGFTPTSYISLAGGNGNFIPTISLSGNDSNLNIRSKGANTFVSLGSAVQFGSYSTANLAVSTFPTGYITIRDSANNYEYKLLCVRGSAIV
jgi:hypothetical protein